MPHGKACIPGLQPCGGRQPWTYCRLCQIQNSLNVNSGDFCEEMAASDHYFGVFMTQLKGPRSIEPTHQFEGPFLCFFCRLNKNRAICIILIVFFKVFFNHNSAFLWIRKTHISLVRKQMSSWTKIPTFLNWPQKVIEENSQASMRETGGEP